MAVSDAVMTPIKKSEYKGLPLKFDNVHAQYSVAEETIEHTIGLGSKTTFLSKKAIWKEKKTRFLACFFLSILVCSGLERCDDTC